MHGVLLDQTGGYVTGKMERGSVRGGEWRETRRERRVKGRVERAKREEGGREGREGRERGRECGEGRQREQCM